MGKKIMVGRNEKYLIFADEETGVMKNVPIASEKQILYIQNLRAQLGKEPLKGTTIPMYQAMSMINGLKAKMVAKPPRML